MRGMIGGTVGTGVCVSVRDSTAFSEPAFSWRVSFAFLAASLRFFAAALRFWVALACFAASLRFFAAMLAFLLAAAFFPAAGCFRLAAAFLPAARRFLVAAAFFAAALRSVALLMVSEYIRRGSGGLWCKLKNRSQKPAYRGKQGNVNCDG